MTAITPKFYAWGPGVVPSYQGTTFNQQFREWQNMNNWCEGQGWRMCEDYFAPAKIPHGSWYFKHREQQMWFTLRWV